jgi:hypothetical protein
LILSCSTALLKINFLLDNNFGNFFPILQIFFFCYFLCYADSLWFDIILFVVFFFFCFRCLCFGVIFKNPLLRLMPKPFYLFPLPPTQLQFHVSHLNY